MAKFRAVRPKGKGGAGERKRGALPCILFLIVVMALLMLLFYGIMKGGH